MLILASNPALGLFFILLMIASVKISKNKYGISLNYKGFQRIMEKYKDRLFIIDISGDSNLELDSKEVDFLRNKDNINKSSKVLIIHDSDISLKELFIGLGLDNFSDHIYQTNTIDHNLKQYRPSN